MSVSSSQLSSNNVSNIGAKEFSIRVPKNQKKKFNIMRFNNNLNVDVAKWTQVKMERENNRTEKHVGEEMPKYGAGSAFRREEKEEARKKKFGYKSKNYNPDDQPWILKCGGKNRKKFRGIREGGVGDNAAYYVFTHGSDGSIEAYPVAEWYNFQPIQRFKALTAEEAEQEFGKRNRSLNYFSLMMRKKLRKDEDDEMDEEGGKTKNKGRSFKISDMDDWIDSDDGDDDESDEDRSNEKETKKKKTKKKVVEKKKANTDESALEESDDGDEEGRELDYISDSSESISDHEGKIDKEMKGVSDESALRKLLTSDEEEEEEEGEKSGDEGNKSEKEELATTEETPQTSANVNKKRKKDSSQIMNSTRDGLSKNEDSFSESDDNNSDSEGERIKKHKQSLNSTQTSLTEPANRPESFAKKARLDSPGKLDISEEAVRRYLTRKPMTINELLLKFKKRTNLNSEQLMNVMTEILKRIKHVKRSDKLYLS